jgi:PD-(D/E)XK nuclease superfamily
MPIPLPWSHSALEAFQTCPRQYEEVKVLRHFKDEKGPASLWGDMVHRAGEQFIADGVPLPPNVVQYLAYFQTYTQRPGVTEAERKYALDRQLQPCDFFAPTVWVRGVLDVLTRDGTVAWIDDHKTGKRKSDRQQLVISALLVFYHHPEIETCHTAFHWLQQGFDAAAQDRETFTRAQMPALWTGLLPKLQRYKAAFDAGVFPPKPCGLCKAHCVVNTCEYWGSGSRR